MVRWYVWDQNSDPNIFCLPGSCGRPSPGRTQPDHVKRTYHEKEKANVYAPEKKNDRRTPILREGCRPRRGRCCGACCSADPWWTPWRPPRLPWRGACPDTPARVGPRPDWEPQHVCPYPLLTRGAAQGAHDRVEAEQRDLGSTTMDASRRE